MDLKNIIYVLQLGLKAASTENISIWVFPKIVVPKPPQIIHLFIGFTMKFSPSILGLTIPYFWVDTHIPVILRVFVDFTRLSIYPSTLGGVDPRSIERCNTLVVVTVARRGFHIPSFVSIWFKWVGTRPSMEIILKY